MTTAIGSYLATAHLLPQLGRIVGKISPHAGYEYSGRSSGIRVCQIQGGDFSTVVLLAPSHAEIFPGVSIYNGDAYLTPLGSAPVDLQVAKEIIVSVVLSSTFELGHRTILERAEHSLEVQLPFLQVVLKSEFKIVPMVIHDFDELICENVAAASSQRCREKSLIIASSDL